jgi:lipopolysaccharide export system permease protein
MFKLTILDKYIIKKFLSTFFIAILLVILIIIIFDFSDKLGKFMDNHIPAKKVIFDYYFSLIPYYLNLFMPLFVFISIIFFTSKMAGRSEFIAMLSNGISFMRISKPYFITALILALFSYLLGNFIIPPANKKKIQFENKYIYYRPPKGTRNIHKQVKQGIFVYIKYYDVNNDVGHIFTIEKFKNNRLVSKMYADNIIWNAKLKKYRANNYWIRNIKKYKDDFVTGNSIDTNIYLTPQDIKENAINIATLNLFQLNKFIKEQRLHGNENLNEFLLEKHKRTALPFSTFILTFIGVAMSSKKVRGGTGIYLGIGLVLIFAYILIQKLSDQWAISGDMTPFWAVWTPNIIFMFISVFVYRFAPK